MNCRDCNTTESSSSSSDDDMIIKILNVFINGSAFFVTGPLMVMSLPMTLLTVLVFYRSPLGTTKTTRIYYSFIAVCNFISTIFRDGLITYSYLALHFITLNTYAWDVESTLYSCRIMDFILFSFEIITNNTYVALALERCIVLYFPLRSSSLVGQRKAAAGVIFIIVTGFLVCSCTLAGASAYAEETHCSINFTASGVLSRLALLMVFLCWITPTGTTIILNTLIVLKMTQARSKSLRVDSQPGQRKTKQNEASVTLVIVTGIHALVYIPMGVFRMLPLLMSLNYSTPAIWNTMAMFGYVWLVTIHVANFIVYYYRVKGFKQNVRNALFCRPAIRTAEELDGKK